MISLRFEKWQMQFCGPVGVVVKGIAIGAEGPGFRSRAGQIGTMSLTARHRCNVSLELCCPGAKPRRRAPPLVIAYALV